METILYIAIGIFVGFVLLHSARRKILFEAIAKIFKSDEYHRNKRAESSTPGNCPDH